MGTEIFIQDTFQDTPGISLATHMPEVGGAWIGASGATNIYGRILNTEGEGTHLGLYPDFGPFVAVRNAVKPAGLECDVSLKFTMGNDGNTPYSSIVGIRLSARNKAQWNSTLGTDGGYFARYQFTVSGSDGIETFRIHKGGNSLIDTQSTRPLPTGKEEHTLVLQCRAASKKILLDGVERLAIDDDTLHRYGFVGLEIYGNGDGGHSGAWGNWKYTEFKAQNYGDPVQGGLVLASFI